MKKNKKASKGSGKGEKKVDFGKFLRGLNKGLDKAKERAAEGGYDEFDDGRYQMRCVDAKIGVSKNKRVQVILDWKFMNGDYKGKSKLDFEGLVEDRLEYLLRKLDAMGYDTSELEDMEKELKDILDDIKKTKPKCKVRLKTKGEFQNVYVDGLLGEEDEEDDDEEESEDDEDDNKKSKKSKKSKKKKDDDDDEDEDDEEEDSDDDEDEDEDEEDSDSDDDDEDEDDEEEDSDDDEDEDEDEEKPKKGKKGKKGKKKDDDDEDEESEDEDEEDDEEEDDEDATDEVDVTVGSIVKGTSPKSGKFKGEVVELFEKDGKVLIKTEKGKTIKIKADLIDSVEESPASSVKSKKDKKKKKKS